MNFFSTDILYVFCFTFSLVLKETLCRKRFRVSHLTQHNCPIVKLLNVNKSCLMTKPTKRQVRPAKTQISLGIRPVWSESSLSTWRKLRSLATHWTHSEDSDQTGRMPRLIRVFSGLTYFVGFVMSQLIHLCQHHLLDSMSAWPASLVKFASVCSILRSCNILSWRLVMK